MLCTFAVAKWLGSNYRQRNTSETLGGMHGFTNVDATRELLKETGYLASDAIATTVYLADVLQKPLLVEGPAGVGKTELAKAIAAATGRELIRLQCYEGVDEARALYEWNHAKQLLRITAAGAHRGPQSSGGSDGGSTARPDQSEGSEGNRASRAGDTAGFSRSDEHSSSWDALKTDVFTEEFLLARPLLQSISNPEPTVLLIDELDKADIEIEGLLLEILSDFAITVPELGTVTARHQPIVVLTSNATRELSEALRRRCLYLHIDYPSAELEEAIVALQAPELSAALIRSVVSLVNRLRELPLRKAPSISETVDWAHTLLALDARTLESALRPEHLGVLLKYQDDIKQVTQALDLPK